MAQVIVRKLENAKPFRPNIYGRKTTEIVEIDVQGGHFPTGQKRLAVFTSRRQARKHRAETCKREEVSISQTRLVSHFQSEGRSIPAIWKR